MDINPVAVESRHERFCRLIPVGQQRGRAHRNEPDSYHERADRVLGTCSWFCGPYHSWERGTVENTIGLVRRFFPKKTEFAMNPRPRFSRLSAGSITGRGNASDSKHQRKSSRAQGLHLLVECG